VANRGITVNVVAPGVIDTGIPEAAGYIAGQIIGINGGLF